MQHLDAIKNTIGQSEKTKQARLLDGFLERVEPIFEVMQVGKRKKRRTKVIGLRFIPRESAKTVIPHAMEIGFSRTGTGSWPPPG